IWSLEDQANDQMFAIAAGTDPVQVISTFADMPTQRLEGHTENPHTVAFSPDGSILASMSGERIRLRRCDTWDVVVILHNNPSSGIQPNLVFDPITSALAAVSEAGKAITIWDLDIKELLGAAAVEQSVKYTSAKIVLVGKSDVGKSCLATRLVEDRYPEDHEHGTTHGMRFLQMEAGQLHPSAKPPEGQRRDVVLWDFGGQDEYQLVHQMFLHDTTLALILIDPTRKQAALDEAQDWNNRLEKHLSGRKAVKLLVGAKQDRKSY
ncbi:GTPase, partial [Candidatus Poribacteria bacterium]